MVFGSTGSGKSVFLRSRFYSWRAAWIDTKLEHDPPGALVTSNVSEAVEAMRAGSWPVVYRPLDADDSPDTEAGLVGRMALALCSCAVVVEEVHTYCRSWAAPPWVARLSRLGRSAGVSSVFTSQRPSEVPRILTSEASHVVVAGSFLDPGDLRYLGAYVSADFAEAARDNPALSYLIFDRSARTVTREGPGIPGLEAAVEESRNAQPDELADMGPGELHQEEPETDELAEEEPDFGTLDAVGARE